MVLPRFLAGEFNLDVYRLAVRNAVSEYVGFAVLTDIHDSAVFSVELANRVVSCHAAVLAQGGNDLVLEFSFRVN